MARKAFEVLEDRFKEKGHAKIWEGEFLLQDQSRQNIDLRRPWKFIMKPGEQRYMTIKFRDDMKMRTSCPHCGTENKGLEDQPTFWRVAQDQEHIVGLMKSSQSCQVTYQRLVELDERDTAKDRAPKSLPRHDVTEEELKYCFRRIILMATSSRVREMPVWRWQCCQCYGSNSVKTAPGCEYCGNHWRCSSCAVWDEAKRAFWEGRT